METEAYKKLKILQELIRSKMENLSMLQQVIDTSTFQSNQKQQLHTIFHHFYHLFSAMCIIQSPICWKGWNSF